MYRRESERSMVHGAVYAATVCRLCGQCRLVFCRRLASGGLCLCVSTGRSASVAGRVVQKHGPDYSPRFGCRNVVPHRTGPVCGPTFVDHFPGRQRGPRQGPGTCVSRVPCGAPGLRSCLFCEQCRSGRPRCAPATASPWSVALDQHVPVTATLCHCVVVQSRALRAQCVCVCVLVP